MVGEQDGVFVGTKLGSLVGLNDGRTLGSLEGLLDGPVRRLDGTKVVMIGADDGVAVLATLGGLVGLHVGVPLLGKIVGARLGSSVNALVG